MRVRDAETYGDIRIERGVHIMKKYHRQRRGHRYLS
jgi:hypothetical protein